MDLKIDEQQKTKIIIISIAIIIGIAIIFGAIAVYSYSQNQKRKREKEEKAEKLQPNEVLDAISKINWENLVIGDCSVDNKGVRQERFSWVNKEGVPELIVPELMDGHNLNIFFINANAPEGSKCCGILNKIQEKIKSNLYFQGFSENQNNIDLGNYIYASENNSLKCIYGYRNIENKEFFCEFGIICGRTNQTLTGPDFQSIFGNFNQEPPYQIVVIDKIVEHLDEKFARGRVGPILFNVSNVFIAKGNKKGEWGIIDNPFGERKINRCKFLLEERIPPAIADKTCYNEDGETVDYEGLYKETILK